MFNQLQDMALFALVVECGSFTAAAQRAGLPKSSVSQRVSNLEQQLGLSRYEVHPNGEIRIYQKLDSSAVTSVLTSADISVQAIYTHHQDLEGYFLELMEQNKSQEKGGIFYA